jgi:hypothetical protein
MKLAVAFKRRCEAIAVDWRYRLGLKAFDPLPAERLLQAIGGTAITPEQLTGLSSEMIHHLVESDDWSAGVIRRHPLLILYHPKHSPARQQSNIMHEIAHILLDHPFIHFDPQTKTAKRDARCEDEAVYLGGCLQIPKLALQWVRQQDFDRGEIASYFGASQQMVIFRANMSGISL